MATIEEYAKSVNDAFKRCDRDLLNHKECIEALNKHVMDQQKRIIELEKFIEQFK